MSSVYRVIYTIKNPIYETHAVYAIEIKFHTIFFSVIYTHICSINLDQALHKYKFSESVPIKYDIIKIVHPITYTVYTENWSTLLAKYLHNFTIYTAIYWLTKPHQHFLKKKCAPNSKNLRFALSFTKFELLIYIIVPFTKSKKLYWFRSNYYEIILIPTGQNRTWKNKLLFYGIHWAYASGVYCRVPEYSG